MSTEIESLELQITSDSTRAANGIEKLSQSLSKLKSATQSVVGLKSLSSDLKKIAESLSPLSNMPKSNLGSYVNSLKKLPEVLKELDAVDMGKLATKMQEVADAMEPLADEMQKVANGFDAFPKKIQDLIKENDNLGKSNKKTSVSFMDIWAGMKTTYRTISNLITKMMSLTDGSMEYVETINLVNVSMGEYADEAKRYADEVELAMGIDPKEWLTGHSVLMSLVSGFGVASDRAYTMSKNLNQLTYDLWSLKGEAMGFNIEESMQKIRSGIAGELEPLRAVGYDLSQARLELEAYNLGIEKNISDMTQAEKAELRYMAIMNQSKGVIQDMSRTLDSPANQMRILKSQTEQAARAIGNFFIPIINKLVPYLNAAIRVARELLDAIASLAGVEISTVDFDGASSGANAISQGMEDAAENAKKLKNYTAGFDELNVLSTSDSSATEETLLGGGFTFDLPEYDFINDATQTKVNEIVTKMKEWLGITGEIDSWADLFHSKLGAIAIAVGAVAIALAAWRIIEGVAGVLDTVSKFGGKNKDKGTGDIGGISKASTKLKTLVKNLGLGIAIIAEVVVAATIFIGGIWLIGTLLEQVGIAWQPVINNAGTIAIAMGIGTALLAGVGLSTVVLGKLGGKMCGQIAIGIAVLAELGVATGLFLAEIWGIGVLLDQIGIAWQPVLDNGETIANAIGWGTALLVGIGVVTALLGAATVASAGALPLAIGLGTAILVELAIAFVAFCESLIKVADKLSDDLHPALSDLNDVLPELNTNMEDFVEFMTTFAELTVEYTKSSAISGFSATVDTIVKFFTRDPIKALSNSAKKQYEQSAKLNDNLDLANPELKDVITKLGEYKSNIDRIKGIADTINTSDMATTVFTDMVTIGGKLADFGKKMKQYYSNIKDIKTTVMDDMVNCVNDVINFAVRIKNEVETSALDNFTNAIKRLTSAVTDLPKSKTLTITAIYKSVGSSPEGFADGGFPQTGQMFIAREAGAEMVGSIGRRTAVANNDQIVAGIASGVASANTESNALLREQNDLLRALLEKERGVYLDGKKITQNVEKHQRERGRVLVTGGAI